jgi:CubicO group peptidase (beta-lactamase class C family)
MLHLVDYPFWLKEHAMTVSQRLMTNVFALSCLIVFGLFPSAAAFADELATPVDPEGLGFSSMRLARIGSWYQARIDAADLSGKDLSGAVVAIAKDGKLAYLQGIGFQDRAKTIPMKPDSIFWIASMTKPVTSVAAMMLVEDGKLDLDAPVAKYLPELKNMQVGTAKTDAATGKTEIALEPPKRPMTVRDLLRHTSGLVYPPQYLNSPVNQLYAKAEFARDKTLADFVASLANLPLAHQPGEVWEYSWGVDVLARVVEVASGQSFDAFLDGRIFKPLHMIDTGFYVPAAKLSRLVEAPEPRNPQFDVTRPRRLLSGGGGLVSTAGDYLRFCQMLLNGGELDGARILKPDVAQLMTTNSLPPDIRFAMSSIGPATGSGWGLGFAVRTNAEFSSVPGSIGSYDWGGLWGTFFWVDPAQKLIAVQMIQVVPEKGGQYQAAIRNLTYGALRVPEPTPFAPPASPVVVGANALAVFVGKYDFGSSSSSRDKMDAATNNYAGIGADIEIADGGVRIKSPRESSPAADAGVSAGDLITEIDNVSAKGLTTSQAIGKLRGPVNSRVRLKISRNGQIDPIDIAVTRAPIYTPAVELQVRLDAGKLMIEATGSWPVLDFEKDKPIPLTALSTNEFYVDSGDHTRIAFVKDSTGKAASVILNPGPWEQRGAIVGKRAS